jgi:hypothetical protein
MRDREGIKEMIIGDYVITDDLFFIHIDQVDRDGGFLIPHGMMTVDEVKEIVGKLSIEQYHKGRSNNG